MEAGSRWSVKIGGAGSVMSSGRIVVLGLEQCHGDQNSEG